MCTAISFNSKAHYFGRNLDLEFNYPTTITIAPRNFPLNFRMQKTQEYHFAMIGVAYVKNNYPLYYDATNEHGLSMAALNFPGNAVYFPPNKNQNNIAPFELIPWVLGQCQSVVQARPLLDKLNLISENFSPELPLSPLHWMLSDSTQSIVLESTSKGLKIYNNTVRVLTNNPPFPYHLYNLQNYINLTSDEPTNRFAKDLDLAPYSRGMGAMGLPGDLSSASRFVRAAFTLHNSKCNEDEASSISQFFNILGSVVQQEGCAQVGEAYEKTIYTSCCNTDLGIYYYKTYTNSRITAVKLHAVDLDSSKLANYAMRYSQDICIEN